MTPVTAIFQDKLDKLVPRILLELRMTEVVVTTGAIRRAKLHSNRLHQQTNTQLFTGRMHFLSSNQQCQSTEGKSITFHWLALPSSPGVFQSCPWPLNAPAYLGGDLLASRQASDVSTHTVCWLSLHFPGGPWLAGTRMIPFHGIYRS